MAKKAESKEWTEYIVRCRRWIRDVSGKKVWETLELGPTEEWQALEFYQDLTSGKDTPLKDPQLIVRTIIEKPYEGDLTQRLPRPWE